MNNQLAHLSSEQTTSLIHSLGLTSVCTLLQSRGKGEVLSSVPGMDSSSLHSFLVSIHIKSLKKRRAICLLGNS